jgi:hypothetical protein
LLQLNAAMVRLKDEGWRCDQRGASFSTPENHTEEPSWWISMYRSIPTTVHQGDQAPVTTARLSSAKGTRPATEYHNGSLQYPKAAGLI